MPARANAQRSSTVQSRPTNSDTRCGAHRTEPSGTLGALPVRTPARRHRSGTHRRPAFQRLPVGATFTYGAFAADINSSGDIVGMMGGFGNVWGSGLAWNRKGALTVTPARAIIPFSVHLSGAVAADTCSGYCNAARFTRASHAHSPAALRLPASVRRGALAGAFTATRLRSTMPDGWLALTIRRPTVA